MLGVLPDFLKNRHRFLEWVTEILVHSPTQTMVFRTPGHTTGVITANPQNVEYIIKTNFENYPKGERSHGMMAEFLGNGIFNSDGEYWRSQRKTASLEFSTRSLRNFVVETVRFETEQRLLPLLERATQKGETVDLQDILERFAFDNICRVAFNVDPACLVTEGQVAVMAEGLVNRKVPHNFMAAFDDAGKYTVDRFFDPVGCAWKVKKLLNLGSERRLKESVKIVHDFAIEIIRAKKMDNTSASNQDLLSRFAASVDNTTEEFLKDNVVNFLIAGRETSSSGLTWFFWLLSTRPEVERKVVEEVRSVRIKHPGSTKTFDFDQLREMHYLHAAITESMRLYSPVPVDSQECQADDTWPDGTFVGKGWFVSYSAYAMGRMETIWGPDCCEYKPERWLVNGEFKPESAFKFPVFHAGPRMCLGKEMAYIQMKSIAAIILERFHIEAVESNNAPKYLLAMTMKMKGGFPVKLTARE